MGYRSDVYLKTTTEGWLIIKRRNDSIENPEHRILKYAEEIKRTPSGFYKIYFSDIKWYESYEEVKQFMSALDDLVEQDIPYSFIRIGEDSTDIEHKVNWTDDMPDEIQTFEPVVDVNDDDWSCYYEDIAKTEKYSYIIGIMFDLFDKYEAYEDIKDALRDMNSDGAVSDTEYDYAIEHWEELSKEWEERK